MKKFRPQRNKFAENLENFIAGRPSLSQKRQSHGGSKDRIPEATVFRKHVGELREGIGPRF
jgi:hypothetical protein